MKRILTILLAGAVVFSMAACGSSQQPASSDQGKSSTSPAAVADKTSADSKYGHYLVEASDPSKLPSQAAARKGVLVIGTDATSGVFSPFFSSNMPDKDSYVLMFAGLSSCDKDGNIIDGTAHMEVSPDGLTCTYTLKPDKFSDGTPVTAKDYVTAIKLIADKSYDGDSDFSTVDIKGYQDFRTGKSKDLAGVKAVDDNTLQITLDQPNSEVQYMGYELYPIDTAKYGDMIKPGDVSAYKAFVSNHMVNYVSNGAYVLTDTKTGESTTLTANPNYFYGEPKIKTIITKVVPNGSELQAVVTGDVDLDFDLAASNDHKDLAASTGFINGWVQPRLGYNYIDFNLTNPMFQDVKVRQALYYAIDRKGMMQAIYGDPSYATILDIPQAPLSWLYDDTGITHYDYDMDKAQELLKEAGWTKNADGKLVDKDGKQMKITFSGTGTSTYADNLVNTLTKAYTELGINFQVTNQDFATVVANVQTGKFDMFSMAWQLLPDPDISGIYGTKGSIAGGAQNRNGYSNPELDKLLVQAKHATTKDEMKTTYQQIYKIINEDLPTLPLNMSTEMWAFNTRLKNFQCSPYVSPFQQDQITKLELNDK